MLDDVKNFWDAIAGRIKGLIHNETKNALRMERYEVTTAPNGSKMGVTKPFGSTELMLPYSREVSTATVGSQVLVAWWGSMSNAKVYFFANGFRGSVQSSDYKIYNSVSDLGQTAGSATIAGVYAALSANEIIISPLGNYATAERPMSNFTAGTVEIGKNSSGVGWIIYHGTTITNGEWRMFISNSAPTGTWLPMTQVDITSGPANLNDYKTPGLYYFSGGVTLTNAPNSATNGWLEVLLASNGAVKQLWHRHGSNPTTYMDEYVRLYASSAWGSWGLPSARFYYGTYSIRGVGVGISTTQVAFQYQVTNPKGVTPTVTVNSGAMTGVGDATSVAADTSRTNARGIGILLNHSGITVGRAYYCLANITVS